MRVIASSAVQLLSGAKELCTEQLILSIRVSYIFNPNSKSFDA